MRLTVTSESVLTSAVSSETSHRVFNKVSLSLLSCRTEHKVPSTTEFQINYKLFFGISRSRVIVKQRYTSSKV